MVWLQVRVEFDALVGLIDGKLSQDEMTAIEELHQYMLEDEGSWALGDGFLHFVGKCSFIIYVKVKRGLYES